MGRGRPKGSRNAFNRPHKIMVRLTEDERGWLQARAQERKQTESDVLRGLIDNARRDEMDKVLVLVLGEHGDALREVDAAAVVNLMDDALREELHNRQDWASEQEFVDAYSAAHLARFGEPFRVN